MVGKLRRSVTEIPWFNRAVMNVRSMSSSVDLVSRHDFARGLWRLADPKISLASFASMFLGACAAAADAPLHWGWLILTVLGIFAIEVAKNASGEVFDFDSGVDLAVAAEDRTAFSGGKRVLVDGILTRGETWAIASIGYAVGVFTGLIIAAARAPAVLWIGMVGVALAFQYHAPPLKLSYRGMGEFAVALCYGPLIALGTYIVQVQRISFPFILAVIPLGLLIAAFLWVNEFPDYSADKAGGKNTLVVRLGRSRAAWGFGGIQSAAFGLLAILPLLGLTPWMLLGLLGLVPILPAIRQLIEHPEKTSVHAFAQRSALLAFLIVALGQGIGFIIGGES